MKRIFGKYIWEFDQVFYKYEFSIDSDNKFIECFKKLDIEDVDLFMSDEQTTRSLNWLVFQCINYRGLPKILSNVYFNRNLHTSQIRMGNVYFDIEVKVKRKLCIM